MKTIHIDKPDAFYRSLIPANYNGRRFELQVHDAPFEMNLNSYWDGGSRDYYTLIDLSTKKQVAIPQNGTMFDRQSYDNVGIPPNVAVIQWHKGSYEYVAVHVSATNAAPLLPAVQDVSDDEKIVLAYTARLKNSYGGETNIRYRRAAQETKITQERWNAAQLSCKARGLLNAAMAITAQGRNVNTKPYRPY